MSTRKHNRRLRLFEKQGGECFYCHRKVFIRRRVEGVTVPEDTATLDHQNPKSRGGHATEYNLVLACHWCNIHKGDMTVKEFVMFLKNHMCNTS